MTAILRPARLAQVLAGVLLCSGLALTRATPAAAQAYSQTVQVEMPDGVKLATDIWRPLLDNGPRPVLLRRTPYGRAISFLDASNYVGAGYVLVSQDVRGRGDSGGEFQPFFDDQVDGKATIDWIASQSWSTGKVGTYSASAEGIVQYMAMAGAPAALRCAHIAMPTHDVHDSLFLGGAWRTELGGAWLTGLGASSVVTLWKKHEVRDNYWDPATLSSAEMAGIKHPVLVVGGMFDIFSHDEVRAYRELRAHVAESARDDQFLVLGPWTHGGAFQRTQGQLLFPEDAPYNDYAKDLVAYFGWCLQGGMRPDFPHVRYYLSELSDELTTDPTDQSPRVAAKGEWRESESFPPPEARDVQLYLQADGTLNGAPPAASDASQKLPVDPAHPLASLGGGNLTTAAGPYDQTTLDQDPGVLVVRSETVSETVEIAGVPKLALWAASATSDVDVIVRAEVLTPMGKAIAVTDGVQRGRFVHGADKITPLTPGEPTLFQVELGPMALRLPAGYALRFAISGTSSPRFEPNPSVATPLADNPTPVATTLTIFRDAAHPSSVTVPLIAGHLPGEVDAGAPADPELDASVSDRDTSVPPGAGEAWPDGSPDVGDIHGEPAQHHDSGCGCRAYAGVSGSPRYAVFGLVTLVGLLRSRRRRARR